MEKVRERGYFVDKNKCIVSQEEKLLQKEKVSRGNRKKKQRGKC